MNDPQYIVMRLLALLIAIPVHEFAHALSAVNNGDDTPRRDGRLTIFPWDHFDPLGAFFCIFSTIFGMGLGWGKPVMVNPRNLRDAKWGMCKIAAWGPFSNFLLAIAFALPLRLGWLGTGNEGLADMLDVFVSVNLALMLFNLIPVGPLDGAKIVVAFLPDNQAFEFSRFMGRYGMMLLFGMIFLDRQTHLLYYLISSPLYRLKEMLIGF
jgi:Zn-dependent protease